MIPAQPFNIFAYISKKNTYILPSGIKKLDYLSWEDAVWDVIKYKKISTGSIALIPSFWCGHVVKNLQNHGVKCEFYEADENFQTEEELLKDAIEKHNPAIVIVLHAVGIENKLISQNNSWISKLPKETILIEDSVHSILNPSKLKIRKANHFIIDSWRKVMPLQGSALYGRVEDMNWSEPPMTQSLIYSISIILLWILFQFSLWCESKSNGNIAKLFGRLAEWSMLRGYDIIGEDKDAAVTLPIFKSLHKRINHEKIKKIKTRQVEIYEKEMASIIDGKYIKKAEMTMKDKGRLRGYPLILDTDIADNLLKKIRGAGLYARFELNDSPWAKLRKVIYLPLGPHLTTENIEEVVNLLKISLW